MPRGGGRVQIDRVLRNIASVWHRHNIDMLRRTRFSDALRVVGGGGLSPG
jgi:hypothetical protein